MLYSETTHRPNNLLLKMRVCGMFLTEICLQILKGKIMNLPIFCKLCLIKTRISKTAVTVYRSSSLQTLNISPCLADDTFCFYVGISFILSVMFCY